MGRPTDVADFPDPPPYRLPLSAAQQREWFRHEWGAPAGTVAVALRLRGDLDTDLLRAALAEVVARHAALRLAFGAHAGVPFQLLTPPVRPELAVSTQAGERPADRERAAGEVLDAELRTRFDLSAGPPVRVRLFRLGADDHVLALLLHPLCADPESAELVLADLARAYSAGRGTGPTAGPTAGHAAGHAAGQPAGAATPVQYPAIVAREQARQRRGDFEDQLRHWQRRLSGLPLVELPADRPRPAVPSGRCGVVRTELDGAAAAALTGLADRRGLPPLAVVLAGFAAVVARYGRHDEVVVGTSLPGRDGAGLESAVGPLAVPVVLRLDISGDPSFDALLGRAGWALAEAGKHADVPFGSVVARLRPALEPSRHPLFTMAVSECTRAAPPAFTGLEAQRWEAPGPLPELDLALRLDIRPGAAGRQSIGLRAEYATDLFDRVRIERLVRHLRRVLDAGCADPSRPLSRLPVLDADERAGLLRQGLGPQLRYRADRLDELVTQQAGRTPEATAVVARGRHLRYAELEERAGRVAAALRSLGVGSGSLVGLLCERDVDLVPSLLGVLKTGAGYVPLDLTYPADRLAMIAEEARLAAVLAQRQLLDRLPPGLSAPVLCLGRDLDLDAPAGAGPVGTAAPTGAAGALSEVLFTSGSTGRPKGVATSHGNVVSYLDGLLDMVPADRFRRVLLATSIAFDACLNELWPPLITGGTLVVVDNLLLASPAELDGISTLNGVPSVLTEFLRVASIPPSVRTMTVGAEPVPAALVRELFRRSAADEIYNMYGPTETTVYVTAARLTRDRQEPVVIGRPMPNARAYVLDRYGEPAPAGVAGELCLAGPGLARGYLRRPGLTADRFVPDPFGPAAERMYRTGDLARWREDGALDFLGRLDTQVKVRGFRIELGEVEAVLARHPAVAAAVAAVKTDPAGDRHLVGYVLPVGRPPSVEELAGLVRRTLPGYMVPAALVVVDRIPRSPNGKLDRAALPAPRWGEAADRRSAVPPGTAVARALAEIWSAVLRREQTGAGPIGLDDDFFAAGGHSLLALRVRAQIRRRFGVSLPVPTLFQARTLGALTRAVEDAMVRKVSGTEELTTDVLMRRLDPGDGSLLTVPRRDHPGEPAPLSPLQERLWFLDRFAAGQSIHHVSVALRLRGELDLAGLRWALGEVLRRHDALRTSIAVRDGTPVQLVAPPVPEPALDPEPVPVQPGEDPQAALRAAVLTTAGRSFDLERGPLLRVTLFQTGPADHVLAVTAHQIICDRASVRLLLAEIGDRYSAFRHGRPVQPADLPIQYADAAVWGRARLHSEKQAGMLRYWQRQLAGLPALELPTDRPRPPVPSFASDQVVGSVSAAATRRLREVAGGRDGTVFTALVAAFDLVLSRYTGQDDIVVGSTVSGRPLPELQALVGPFANMVVLRTDLSGDPTFAELLDRVREVVRGSRENQEVPFGEVVRLLRPDRDPSRNPLFQVGVQLPDEAPAPVLSGLDASTVAVQLGQHPLDLSLVGSLDGERLELAVEYGTDLFDRARVQRMVEHVGRVLEAVAADPSLRLSQVPLLSDPERADVLRHWQGRPSELPREPLHVQIAEQVARTPDAPAAVFAGESLTYRELDRRAGLLARYLRSVGVRHEDIVGLALDRGLDALVGLLGVVKAGAAFLPLDPEHPAARLGLVLEDAAARVVITHSTLAERLPRAPGRAVVRIDQVWPAAQELAGEPLPEWATGRSAAYLLTTSGSTGTPKGVLVEHAAMTAFAAAMASLCGIGPGDRMLQFASLVFDLAEGEIFAGLTHGATLVLVPKETIVSPAGLAELIRRERVTYLGSPPAVLALVEAEPYPDLRSMLVGGEAYSGDLVNRWNLPGRRFLNGYGPTEAAVACTAYLCEHVLWTGPPPIGRALPNRRVYLLDRWGNPVPVGVPGEIVVAGEGLARGYHRNPRLTAERFIPDPFHPGQRAYRTGDLGAWTEQGQIQFVGRVDTQVKLHGLRIELGEIEVVLARHPAVGQAVVTLRLDGGGPAGAKQLVAYTVPDGPAPATRALREHLAEHLPDYMIPAAFVSLDSLPLLASGKVDRAALPAPDAVSSTSAGTAPRTATEQAVADMFADLLQANQVGAADNFFELGGNSLQAALVLSRILDTWGVTLAMRDFYADPAVESVARTIEDAVLTGAAADDLASLLDEAEFDETFEETRGDD